MQQLIESAKRILMKLNEIQPNISTAGLDYETELIQEMKKDLGLVVWGPHPDPVVVEKILDSQLVDVLSSMDYFLAALEKLGQLDRRSLRNSERFDDLLRLAMCSAESFANRTGDFLSSKQSFGQILGDCHVSNLKGGGYVQM
jgi:hypothetical protein